VALAQQCICAIELIATRLLGGERDEELAATESGRAWTALLERVQGSLLAPVPGDTRLAGDKAAPIPGSLVERAHALLEEFAKRQPEAAVRADLRTVAGRLGDLAGATVGTAMAALRRRSPPGQAP